MGKIQLESESLGKMNLHHAFTADVISPLI